MTFDSQDEFKKKPDKRLSFEEAKLKAASFCAYQERYQQETRDKLYSYGLHHDDVEELLSYLISEGFVNEERFARAFAGGRFRLKKWGRKKIEMELKFRQISSYCINKGLEEIDQNDYIKTLEDLIKRKSDSLTEVDGYKKKSLIASYLFRKGFENSLVWDTLNSKFKI